MREWGTAEAYDCSWSRNSPPKSRCSGGPWRLSSRRRSHFVPFVRLSLLAYGFLVHGSVESISSRALD